MAENEYEQIKFPVLPSQQHDFQFSLVQANTFLSKEEEINLLSTIKLQESQNLLDLSFEEETQKVKNIQYIEFVKGRIATVHPPITVSDGYLVSYKLYKVNTKKQSSAEFDTAVDRRYSDFQYLHAQLEEHYGGCVIPKLPQKNVWASLDMETYEDKNRRKNGLEKYINSLLKHEKLRNSQELKEFLFDTKNNFSQKKGEFTSHIKVEDKIKVITFSAYSLGTSIINKYLYPENCDQQKINLNRTKEDTEILQYELLIRELAEVCKELNLIVQTTVLEIQTISEISALCEGMDQHNIDSEELLSSYENFCDFIESCERALMRRQKLRQELEYLKIEEERLQSKNRNNPRSIDLDIIHSQIKKKSTKCKKWTKDLMEQLQPQIDYGKSLIKQYLDQLSTAKSTLYYV